MVEHYEPWQPLDSTIGEFFIVWFEHRPETGSVLEVEPSTLGRILRVRFDDAIAFRMQPRDVMMTKWWSFQSFYQVLNSEWVASLKRDSQGIWSFDFMHFGCCTIDGCYEVLTATHPSAEWIKPDDSLNPAARGDIAPS